MTGSGADELLSGPVNIQVWARDTASATATGLDRIERSFFYHCMGKQATIASTADRVFYTEGFSGVGMDRVVSEASIALGTLYRHFGNKSGLVVAALEHRQTAYLAELKYYSAGKTGHDRVLSLFDTLLDWAERNGGNGCFFLRAAADHPHVLLI